MSKVVPLRSFIDSFLAQETLWFNQPVILFTSRIYPLLFFSSLVLLLKKKEEYSVLTIDSKTLPKHEILRHLQSSFLGLKSIFWFGSLSDFSPNEQQFWLDFLSTYKGPHTILAWCDNNELLHKKSVSFIEIPDALSFEAVLQLIDFFQINVERVQFHYFFKKILTLVNALSVDHACLLLSYFQVTGKNNEAFFKEVLPLIIKPTYSLFSLSEAFFEKNSKKFSLLWTPLAHQFSIQFWIAFWSEQIWRSYFYIVYMKSGSMSEAKKIAYKLPFSFIQTSWKKHNLETLLEGHEFLYTIDYASKNNSLPQEGMLELFYFKCMAR